MGRFSGVCDSGPYAGLHVTHGTSRLHVARPKHVSPSYVETDESGNVEYSTGSYTWDEWDQAWLWDGWDF